MALGSWQLATVSAIVDETPRVKTITFELPDWPGHLAGQHVDIRLTADDGYQAQRSYSIGSAPSAGRLELTVERVPDGEVSSFVHDALAVGDRIELRGPIGGYFVWHAVSRQPLLLVAGGSGVVPLMAMLRQRAAIGTNVPATLLYSSRTPAEVIYADELERLGRDPAMHVAHTLTREQPAGWPGYRRRIDRQMLAEVLAGSDRDAQAFVCGPTALVESVAADLVALGLPPAQVKTERFGPSGG
jgi:ferredoxin-NADP reductase